MFARSSKGHDPRLTATLKPTVLISWMFALKYRMSFRFHSIKSMPRCQTAHRSLHGELVGCLYDKHWTSPVYKTAQWTMKH